MKSQTSTLQPWMRLENKTEKTTTYLYLGHIHVDIVTVFHPFHRVDSRHLNECFVQDSKE